MNFDWFNIDELNGLVQENILYLSIAIAAIVGKLKETSKQSMISAWIVYFIGTLFHELSHFVVSLVSFGKPYWFSVLPYKERSEDGVESYVLGHVKSKNMRWWNVFFISMAPLILIPLSYIFYLNFFNYVDVSLFTLMFYVFVIISLLFSAIPSSVDFKNVFNRDTPANIIIPAIVFVTMFFYWDTVLSFWSEV